MRINFYPDRSILECEIEGTVRDIKADSIVRNELNGKRHLHDPSQVVHAMTADPYKKYPVMPRSFPIGSWNVYRPRAREDRYLAPYFIPTDAEQYLPVWELDENGGYDHATAEHVLDLGYGVHFSISRTTVGCIRIHREDELFWLVAKINKILDAREPITLNV